MEDITIGKVPTAYLSSKEYKNSMIIDKNWMKEYIRKNGRKEKIFYDGKLIKDITPYIQEKGEYYISIDAKYKNTTSKLEFFIKQK